MNKIKRFGKYEKEIPKPIKVVAKEIPKVEPKKEVKEEPRPLFHTSDPDLTTKLQNKFQIENITYDPITEKRNFTFKATIDEVNTFLKGG